MDEPTAALGVEQQAKVGELIAAVRAEGIPVVLVSHNMPQVHALCDRIVVMFRGHKVVDRDARSMTIEDIIASITGANVTETKFDKNSVVGPSIRSDWE